MPSDFDIAAASYDSAFTFSEIGKAQRKRVYSFLEKYILAEKNQRVLELNCGTGEDAIYLAGKGHQVIATDISEAMINAAQAKQGDHKVTFKVLDINALPSESFETSFDLVFSNFGGLNCLSPLELGTFFKRVPEILSSGGKLVLVIMPRNCLWERFYFLLKRNKAGYRRRKQKGPVVANVSGVEVATWYYNPGEVVTLADSNFTPIRVKPIGLAIPPSYMEPFFEKRKGLLRFLQRIEQWFNTSFWSRYADHFIIELQKK